MQTALRSKTNDSSVQAANENALSWSRYVTRDALGFASFVMAQRAEPYTWSKVLYEESA